MVRKGEITEEKEVDVTSETSIAFLNHVCVLRMTRVWCERGNY